MPTSAIDVSSNAFTITNNNVTFSNTSPAIAGAYYGIFNGTSSGYTVPNNSAFYIPGDFTIELRLNPSSLPSSGNTFNLVMFSDNGSNNGFQTYLTNQGGTQKINFDTLFQGITENQILVTQTLSTSTWSSLAFVQSGTSLVMYLNGSSIGSMLLTTNMGNNTGFGMGIGSSFLGGNYFHGDIQEVRVSNIARYTSNYTPATTQFTSDANTMLLVHTTSDVAPSTGFPSSLTLMGVG